MVQSNMEHVLQVSAADGSRPGYNGFLLRASLPAIAPEAHGAYVAAFATAAQELHGRLRRLYSNPFARAVADNVSSAAPASARAASLWAARAVTKPILELAPDDLTPMRLSAPEGPPSLRPSVQLGRAAPPRGDLRRQLRGHPADRGSAMTLSRTPHLLPALSRARGARQYLALLARARADHRQRDAARLLSSSGGGVAFTVGDNYRIHRVEGLGYVHMVRHALGLTPEGQDQVRDDPTNAPDMATADHLLRCPGRATRMHDCLRITLVQLLTEHTSIKRLDITVEPAGLTDSAQRPTDVLLSNHYGHCKHLILDAGVTSALTNSGLARSAMDQGSAAQD